MRRVAVLGGGPAGAYAAERLAGAGLEAILFDEKLAWEKPCGGGLTYKAYSQYPFLIDNATPKRLVRETRLAAPEAGSVKMQLNQPLVVYSRLDLNRMLLDRAERAGARLEKARVTEVEHTSGGWRIRTRRGSVEADFCVVATGARNPLRNVGTEWTRADTMHALGYYVPVEQEYIDIQFFQRFEGYIWVFPRCGHLSVGICGKGEPAAALRLRLERYMEEKGIPLKGAAFFSHVLPSLEFPAWRRNRVCGERWVAVGDAGGLCDPITGEGIYYAIRSADLASQVVIADCHAPAEKHRAYRQLLQRDFGYDLELAASLAKRLFLDKFLFSSVPARMIQFMRRSPRFCDLVQDLFDGTQTYTDLKVRLLRNLNGTLHEIIMGFFFHRLIPGENRV
jgi:flavin-dependent dehydrogenase